MAAQAQTQTTPEQKIQELRALFADASEVGKKALENVLKELTSQASETRRRQSKAPAGSALVSASVRS